MATAKQRAANRLNSQNSTGPRTPQGKAAARFNSLKHGIFAMHQVMSDEKTEDLDELTAEFHHQFSPANPNERFLVDTLIHNEWRLRRLRRVEAELWEHATNVFLEKNIETMAATSANSFTTADDKFLRLQRVVDSCECTYHRALKEIQRFQAVSPKIESEAEDAPQPQDSKPETPELAPLRQTPLPELSATAPALGQTPPHSLENRSPGPLTAECCVQAA